jgi:hypothetical protein
VQNQDVIFRQFFQPDLKLDWMVHSYIELSVVTKVDNHSRNLVVGYFDFLDDFTSDRAVGTPAANRFRFSQYAPPEAYGPIGPFDEESYLQSSADVKKEIRFERKIR